MLPPASPKAKTLEALFSLPKIMWSSALGELEHVITGVPKKKLVRAMVSSDEVISPDGVISHILTGVTKNLKFLPAKNGHPAGNYIISTNCIAGKRRACITEKICRQGEANCRRTPDCVV